MRGTLSGAGQARTDKKRQLLTLRIAVTIAAAYVVLFTPSELQGTAALYALCLLLSNVLLAALPEEVFVKPGFSVGLLLADSAVVLAGMQGVFGLSQSFLVAYFFVMFLATGGESVGRVAAGSAIVGGLYAYSSWVSNGRLETTEWLRLPLLLLAGLFCAYVASIAKEEQRRRHEQEHDSRRLELLRQLVEALSPSTGDGPAWAEVTSGMLARALPEFVCSVMATRTVNTKSRDEFPIGNAGRIYGLMRVRPLERRELWRSEDQFFRLVASSVGNALFACEQARAALESARVKEDFLRIVSHELRTPLHAVLGYTDMIESSLDGGADPFVSESVGRVRANACRLQDLIEEILAYAELRSGKRTVRAEPVAVRDLFEQTSVSMEEQLAGRPIDFQWEVAPDVPELRLDRRNLRQILAGLLSNAAKFTEEGFIRLSARRRHPGQVEILVRDSGIGIDTENLAVIFEDFRQLDGSLTRSFSGVGLGLALARELVGILGGSLEVESEPKRGTTFRVLLPLELAAGNGRAALAAGSAVDSRPVEDSVTNAAFARSMATAAGR